MGNMFGSSGVIGLGAGPEVGGQGMSSVNQAGQQPTFGINDLIKPSTPMMQSDQNTPKGVNLEDPATQDMIRNLFRN